MMTQTMVGMPKTVGKHMMRYDVTSITLIIVNIALFYDFFSITSNASYSNFVSNSYITP